MILLVSGATTTVSRFTGHPALGRLIQPRSWNRVDAVARSGMPWGADNDALAGVRPDAYLAMLDAIARAPRDQLKFVAAPDAVERTANGIVGSWEGTLWLWRCWRPALAARGLPAAIVLQDGATPDSVPWGELSAVFVGASTQWKLSRGAELLVRMARARGLWVHVGRVNTMKRVARVEAMGVNSFDGGQFSRFPDKVRRYTHMGIALAEGRYWKESIGDIQVTLRGNTTGKAASWRRGTRPSRAGRWVR